MNRDEDADAGFLSRWSRRKAIQARGQRLPDEPAAATQPAAVALAVAEAPPLPPQPIEPQVPATPPPTLDDVAALTREADFSRFVAAGVDDGVKRAALRKLFSDPHFNVMDGLDTYIGDYNTPDPLPASMLRKMTQSASLGLFSEDDENPDLQLQPDDADRRTGAGPGAVGEPGGDVAPDPDDA
jgi:hypothetical protein